MSFLDLHKWVSYLIATLGLLALTIGAAVSVPFMIVVFGGVALSWFAEEPLISNPRYERGWTAVVVLGLIASIASALTGGSTLDLIIRYAALLQVARLASRRTAREHLQIAVLAFLHLIAATIMSGGLDYAFSFVGFVIVTPWMLALTHLRAEIESHYEHELDPKARRILLSKEVAGPKFLAASASLAIPLFIATAAFFLIFPRVGVGFMNIRGAHGRQVSGFGQDVDLGGFGTIRADPTVVLRVKLPPQDNPAQRLALRMRGTSFDHFEDGRWTRSTSMPRRVPGTADYYPLRPYSTQQTEELQLILDPIDEQVIFLPTDTVGLKVAPKIVHGLPRERMIAMSPGLDVRYTDGDASAYRYTAVVAPGARFLEPLEDEARAEYTRVPEEARERLQALVDTIAAGAEDEPLSHAELATKILRTLRDSGEYGYSLEQVNGQADDPLASFLFETKQGHCEFFSTAMALLLRTAGVPARNVTGFVGGIYNPYGEYYAIRQGDAHSWIEAYIDGEWVMFDPTPPARGELLVEDGGVMSRVRAFIDAMRTRWSREIVGFDLRKQVGLLRRVMGFFKQFRSEAESTPGDREDDDDEKWSLPALGSVDRRIPFGFGALALIAFGYVLYSRRRPHDPLVDLMERLDGALARVGRPRPETTTPLARARSLSREDHPDAPIVTEVTEAYLDARFGNAELSPERMKELRKAIGTIQKRG